MQNGQVGPLTGEQVRRLGVVSVVLLAGVAVSTVMIRRYVNLALMGLWALVVSQLFTVAVGALLAFKVAARKLTPALLAVSGVALVLAIIAPRPEKVDEFVVGWSSPTWSLMVLPGVLVFGCWMGVLGMWAVLSAEEPSRDLGQDEDTTLDPTGLIPDLPEMAARDPEGIAVEVADIQTGGEEA